MHGTYFKYKLAESEEIVMKLIRLLKLFIIENISSVLSNTLRLRFILFDFTD